MSTPAPNYSLLGPQGEQAVQRGLVSADWYTSTLPRKRLKELMQRRDGPAIRDTLIWFAALVATGTAGYLTWGTAWTILPFAIYGVLYSSASDSRWHECGHGTAFKTQWMNDVIYHVASFMVLREPGPWRWSHARHHTDTIIVGRDPEIHVPRPPDIAGIFLNLLFLKGGFAESTRVVRHSLGGMTDQEKTYVPESEFGMIFLTARVWMLVYAAVVALAVVKGSILPLMFIGLPSFYGAWLMVIFGLTQHAGLAEDVLDHRLNCRTLYLNPVFRFIYWNMNYHLEHHLFPMVPYHALPQLHAELKADLPTPYHGLWAAYREIIPALLRQIKDPSYYVRRTLPATAQPFRPSPAPTRSPAFS